MHFTVLVLCILFEYSSAAANFYYTGSGGFQDRCPIACYEGYFLSAGTCLPKTYVVQFQVAITLPPASTFNVRKYIASMATLAGMSGCDYTPRTVIINKEYETVCTSPKAVIKATVDTMSTVVTSSFSIDRRLLAAAGTADVVTEIRVESDPIKATAVQQSITTEVVSARLSADSVGSTTSVSAPQVKVELIVPATTAAASTTAAPTAAATTAAATTKKSTTMSTQKAATPTPTTTPFPATTKPAPPQTTPVSDTDSSGSNIGIIIGSAAGAVVFVGAGVGLAFCFVGKPKKKVAPATRASSSNSVIQKIVKDGSSNPSAKSRFTMPHIAPDASLAYGFPEQLYPSYPLQHIQIHRMPN